MHGFKSYIHSFTAKAGRRIKTGKPLKETAAWRIGFGRTQNPLNEMDIREEGSVKRAIVKEIKKLPYDGYVYDFCGCDNEAFFAGESPVLAHNTNRPDVLDPALLRPGRFDRRIVLDLPDLADREAILKIHSRGKPLDKEVALKQIAIRTPGFSGADLANLMNEAAILAARRNQAFVKQDDLYSSIERVILGPERKSRIISPKEKEITAYHEAGHALVAAGLKDADPVQKVSIISRGMAGGYTLKLPLEDRHLKTKSQFLADLAVAMGGYVSEQIVFKEVSTGASNDLRQATEISKKLITQYGMSEHLGPRTFGKTQELIFLGREISTEKDYSEKIASVIDEEVNGLIGKAHNFAKKIISTKERVLDAIAKALMEKETLEQEEFYKIVKSYNLKPVAIR
jgi:cell division protease FtsH